MEGRLRPHDRLAETLRSGIVEPKQPTSGIVQWSPLWLFDELQRNELRELHEQFRTHQLNVDLYRLETADLLRRVATGSDVLEEASPKPWRLRKQLAP